MELKLTPRFLQNGQRFFGPGVAELLERVREHRSLRAAAASMEMAYSKAWRIIHEAEEGFGFRLLDSTIGGRHGGGASLTPEAEQLLADYRRFEADIFAYSQARFQENRRWRNDPSPPIVFRLFRFRKRRLIQPRIPFSFCRSGPARSERRR